MTRRRHHWTRWLAAGAAVALLVLTTAGCNTLEGMGKDLEAVGRAIRESAER